MCVKCDKIFINNLQSSANSTAFIARGGQIFPRPQYNFSNSNVQIHNHYGQSGWTIDSWHCDTFCPLKVIRFFEETDINIFYERTTERFKNVTSFVINLLNNKTIILLNLAEYRRRLSIRRHSARFRRIIIYMKNYSIQIGWEQCSSSVTPVQKE